jgi:hypothetical protein
VVWEAVSNALSEVSLDRKVHRRDDIERIRFPVDNTPFSLPKLDRLASELLGERERGTFHGFAI